MKKIIILLLVGTFILSSCGPRRYKCGPYRRCDNSTKIIKNSIDIENQLLDNNC